MEGWLLLDRDSILRTFHPIDAFVDSHDVGHAFFEQTFGLRVGSIEECVMGLCQVHSAPAIVSSGRRPHSSGSTDVPPFPKKARVDEAIDIEKLPDTTEEEHVPTVLAGLTTAERAELKIVSREVHTPFFLEEDEFEWWKKVQDQIWAS